MNHASDFGFSIEGQLPVPSSACGHRVWLVNWIDDGDWDGIVDMGVDTPWDMANPSGQVLASLDSLPKVQEEAVDNYVNTAWSHPRLDPDEIAERGEFLNGEWRPCDPTSSVISTPGYWGYFTGEDEAPRIYMIVVEKELI